MPYVSIVPSMLRSVTAAVPTTLRDALNTEWLATVLSHLADNSPIASIETIEEIKAMATKVRIAITFANTPQDIYQLCIKGFLDYDLASHAANTTALREALFYADIGPQLNMHIPPCAAVVMNSEKNQALLIMADMIAAGDHFYSALEPLSVDQTAQTLDQLARLHAQPQLLRGRAWIPDRLKAIVTREPFITWEEVQALMHDGRGNGLPAKTLDAGKLKCGMQALATKNASLSTTLLHGDGHPGNIYRSPDGTLGFTDWQLLQRGHWSTDVAYHIASVLPIEVAEKEERHLLSHYLGALQKHGGATPGKDSAWNCYRRAVIYGYYHWAVTRRVAAPITREAFSRLGAAVTRLDSYSLLGI